MSPNEQAHEAILNAVREAGLRRPEVDERRPACLPEVVLAGMAEGALSGREAASAIAHLSRCRRCQRELASLVRAMNDPEVRRAAPPRGLHRSRIAAVLLPIAAAAAVIFAVVKPDDRQPARVESPHRAPVLTPGAEPVGESPVGAVSHVVELRWSTVPAADIYRVTLFDADGRVLLEAEAHEANMTLPDSIRLAPSQRYLWQVQARVGFDRWVSSDLVEFRVISPP